VPTLTDHALVTGHLPGRLYPPRLSEETYMLTENPTTAPSKAGFPGATLLRDGKRTLRSLVPQSVLNWREEQFYLRYGEVELHLLGLLCDPQRDAIDVGANDGCYVHFMRKYARMVHAFEPMPSLAAALREKFESNVTVHPVALSRESGETELRIPVVDGVAVTGCSTISDDASATYPGYTTVRVALDRLDAVYQGDVGFIKIDVEGHEQAVLDGAVGTIRRCQPRMLVEVDERLAPGGLARARRYFDELGYRGYFIADGGLHLAKTFSPEKYQRPENLPDLTAPLTQRKRFGRYVYNFIFLPGNDAPDLPQRIAEKLKRL
jgi:FkbM family methyltransferase